MDHSNNRKAEAKAYAMIDLGQPICLAPYEKKAENETGW